MRKKRIRIADLDRPPTPHEQNLAVCRSVPSMPPAGFTFTLPNPVEKPQTYRRIGEMHRHLDDGSASTRVGTVWATVCGVIGCDVPVEARTPDLFGIPRRYCKDHTTANARDKEAANSDHIMSVRQARREEYKRMTMARKEREIAEGKALSIVKKNPVQKAVMDRCEILRDVLRKEPHMAFVTACAAQLPLPAGRDTRRQNILRAINVLSRSGKLNADITPTHFVAKHAARPLAPVAAGAEVLELL